MSQDIGIDTDEWIEIEFDENEPEYEPGSVEFLFKQKIIFNKKYENIINNNNNNDKNKNNKLSESFESSKGLKSIKSPSPVIINSEHIEGFPNFDVKSMDSFCSLNSNNNNNNSHNNNNNNNNSNVVKKQGNKHIKNGSGKIPFSWAEITKIGQLPGEKSSKPKIRLLTNCGNKKKSEENVKNNENSLNKNNNNSNKKKKLTIIDEEVNDLPEADPNCTKHDLGRSLKHRRFGRKGNRVRYPNGKRGSKRNSRRKR